MANDLALNAARGKAARGGPSALLRDPWFVLLLALAALALAWAATDTTPAAVRALWHWSPALLRGLGVNIQISVLAMALGTVVGLAVGALSLSPSALLRRLTRAYVLLFRNAPILVLVYFTTYVFPFELSVGGWSVPFPDWIKVVIGSRSRASANVAGDLPRAIQSIPSAQWEAAQSLAFRRAQIFRMIVLPQCVRRMLPSWMNLYASITMSTSLDSLVGVHDLVDTATVASNTVARRDFTILVYFTLLALFFAYCYPIARWTRYLERRHEHH